jgi:hypothetical protein
MRRIVVAILAFIVVSLIVGFIYLRSTAAPILDKDMSFFEAGRPELARDPAVRRMAIRAQLDYLCNPVRDQFVELGGGPASFLRAYRNDTTGQVELVLLPWFSHVTDTSVLYRFSPDGRMLSKEIQ